MTEIIICISAAVAVFLLTALILHFLIPVLASKKMGQKILDIGPRWHKNKEGTPTMGGLSFIIASVTVGIVLCVLIAVEFGFKSVSPLIMTLALGLSSGLIGMIDDRAKLKKKQNEGLTAPQKFGLQMLISALYLVGMSLFCDLTTELYIPFVGAFVDFGIFYYVIAEFLLCGIMNSVNLTDGIDGLASSVTLVISVFFGIVSFMAFDSVNVGLSAVSALLFGSCAGFLVYNFYPARVFMGDTGSLFLGGLVVGAAFMMNNPLIIVIAGLIYIIETASDILQVGYFKLTHGKRLFKMAPIHHHFEKCGWSEVKIVTVFSCLTALFCALSWLGL